MTTRLVQLRRGIDRAVGLVDEPSLRLLRSVGSVYDLAFEAIASGHPLSALVAERVMDDSLPYDEVHAGRSEWRILPAIDHPREPSRCLVTGTGLTHMASARNRDAMHAAGASETDSMRMFRWGVEGGRPSDQAVGTAPEWFYKGTGDVLRGHGEPLVVPAHAEDGGEEPEVAGCYVVGPDGGPRRVGFAMGNEFSDHAFERRNYLYLAASKLMPCAIGPELVLDHDFRSVPGVVSVERGGSTLWSHAIRTGDQEMCHSLRNLEHHHFKFPGHRVPGQVHVHFLGADAFSFGAGITLVDGDVMTVAFDGFGRPLRNPLTDERAAPATLAIRPLG